MTQSLEFSIILPVWHGGKDLRDALQSLQQIDYPADRFEVIIAGVHDDTISQTSVREIITDAAFSVRFVAGMERHRAKLLNIACRAARGNILVFADDDCVFRSDWLKTLQQVCDREPELGIVGGVDELESDGSAFALALDYVLQSFAGTGGIRRQTSMHVGTYYPRLWNMAVPREVAWNVTLCQAGEPAQIFRESLAVHEDVDLGDRIAHAGKRVVFAPEVRVGHRRDTTFGRFVRRGLEKAQTSRMLGIHRVAHRLLAAWVIGMVMLGGAAMFSAFWACIFVGMMGIYGTVLLITSVLGVLQTKNLKTFALIPGLVLSLHVARGIGYLLPQNIRWHCNKIIR